MRLTLWYALASLAMGGLKARSGELDDDDLIPWMPGLHVERTRSVGAKFYIVDQLRKANGREAAVLRCPVIYQTGGGNLRYLGGEASSGGGAASAVHTL